MGGGERPRLARTPYRGAGRVRLRPAGCGAGAACPAEGVHAGGRGGSRRRGIPAAVSARARGPARAGAPVGARAPARGGAVIAPPRHIHKRGAADAVPDLLETIFTAEL